jgi:protein gp37
MSGTRVFIPLSDVSRIDLLQKVPAAVRFLSIEPMIEVS